MVLLDSSIVLSFRDPKWGEALLSKTETIRLATCNVVVAEVLGSKDVDKSDAYYFAQLFATMVNQPLDEDVTKVTVDLLRSHAMQLPDAIVAATALSNDMALWTHDTDVFRKVPRLNLVDPIVTH